MKWVPQDIDKYLKSKEYVDTAVVSLLPLDFSVDMRQAAAMSEFINLVAGQVERQFTGRIILLPAFVYLKNESDEKNINNLQTWESEIKRSGIKQIFYITSDSTWKMREDRIEGSIIWLPSLPLDKMDHSQKGVILEDQVKQLTTLFMQKWQESE